MYMTIIHILDFCWIALTCFTLMDSAKTMATRLNLSWLICCRRSHQMEMCPLWMSFASMKLWTRPSFHTFDSRYHQGIHVDSGHIWTIHTILGRRFWI